MSDLTHKTDAAPMPTTTDLALLGAALWSWVAAVNRLGHANPGSTLDYTTGLTEDLDASAADWIVRDFVAWTSGRKHLVPGCEERLRSYVVRCGWQDRAVGEMATALLVEDVAS